MTTGSWHDVGSVADLTEHRRVIAKIGGREVGVVADPTTGEPRGIRNRCPHHGAPLCLGHPARRVESVGGTYALGDRSVIRCPWHGWEYDLTAGECPDEPSVRAAVYPARIEGDCVQILLPPP
jgi:nitrite reductase (NADH) small subunit